MVDVLLTGLAATGLGLLQLFAWLALGTWALRAPDGTAAPALISTSLLAGSAITGCIYALCAAAGQIQASMGLAAAVCILAVALNYRRAWGLITHLARLGRELAPGLWAAVLVAVLLLYWVIAIAPPRDADVMRYHLAHIRQIDRDGGWLPIPDYHYALPFGWSFNYLPFEHLGLPQTAHVLNLGLWLAACGLLFDALRPHTGRRYTALWIAFFACHPLVLKMASTAYSDMVLLVAFLSAGVLLARLPDLATWDYRLIGFSAWIGAQSRYQAIAVGLAITCAALILSRRRDHKLAAARAYAAGAAWAMLLSSPFYIFNWLNLGNPAWPLLVPTVNGLSTYANTIAAAYSQVLAGHLALPTLLAGLWDLVKSPSVFPIPLLALGLMGAAARKRSPYPARAMALVTSVFMVVWSLAQPKLYPRFSLLLIGPVILGWGPLLEMCSQARLARRAIQTVLTLMVAAFVGINGLYARDYLGYLVSGGQAHFHRATWFYDVYNWVNRSTPEDARCLVIVFSGQSYYLERAYRRADPATSGVVDWSAITRSQDLERWLQAEEYDYIIYENRDWRGFIGGQAMQESIEESIALGKLTRVAAFTPQLNTSRIGRQSYATTVWILATQPH